jgi:hypothetical protein
LRWLNRHPIGPDLDEEMQLIHLRNQISFEGWFQAAHPLLMRRRNSSEKIFLPQHQPISGNSGGKMSRYILS